MLFLLFGPSLLLLLSLPSPVMTENATTTGFASSPLERSASISNALESKECQTFYNDSFFSTYEDNVSCGKVADYKCPKSNDTFWFPLLKGERLRWTCKKDKGIVHHRDVLIGHRDKIIFVNVTKSASTTIRQILKRQFGILEQNDQASLKTIDNLEDYFIFSFVRDPLKRLESGMGQAQREGIRMSFPEMLDSLSNGCVIDKHLWTVARYLNVHQKDGQRIRYDFIGSLENIDEDLNFLLPILRMSPTKRRAALRALAEHYEAAATAATDVIPVRHANRGAQFFHTALKYDDEETRKKVCRIVEHDYVCLGQQYRKPDFCW